MDNPRKKSLKVLMLPWLAHGHVIPCLELAKRLTQELNNVSIHFCSTPIILKSIRDNLHHYSTVSDPSSINLVEIPLPEKELPADLHTTKHLSWHLIPSLARSFEQSEETFSHILETLKPDLLIFDIFQPWAANLAHQHNIPAVLFIGCTVWMSWLAHGYFKPSKEFPFPAMNLTKENQRQKTGPAEYHHGFSHMLEQVFLSWQLTDYVIARSFRKIEAKYIDYFSTLIGKELYLTGPLIPDVGSVSPGNCQEIEKVRQWLDQREARSVVFVSFGSECFIPYNQMEQLAQGLELSGACFIWVARFPKSDQRVNEGDCEETNNMLAKALLHALVERVGPQRGLVIPTWAPQQKILHHRNLGTFLTHCGWSSILESMQAGISMLALPMDWDQPINAKLIVELGIGIQIPQRGLGNYTGEDVSACIKQILQSEYGDSVRKNAEDLAEVIRNRKDDEIQILGCSLVLVRKKNVYRKLFWCPNL